MFPARLFAAAPTVTSVLAGAFLAVHLSAGDARAEALAKACDEAAEVAVLPSPVSPWKGAPLRVMFAAEKALEGELSLIAPDGRIAAKSRQRQDGPPYSWFVEVAAPAAGTWHVQLARAGAPAECSTITREIAVRGEEPPRLGATGSQLRNDWDRATENLYSAWIEKLFDDPLDATPSWPALHEVLRDRSRNFLFNHLGLREDEAGLIYRPDCADLPYFLRAYFALKMGLPFGYSKCSRGVGVAPKCPEWFGTQSVPNAAAVKQPGLVAAFGAYVRTVADAVHSGSARTALKDENTDYYPVALNQETLRPGTIYADPYGHVLVLVRRLPQADGAAGLFLAVDAQPDGTVARKRFWRGNFLFAQDPTLGGPGFKRFRPIVRDRNGVLRRLTNAEIAKNSQYGDFSIEQSQFGLEDFYDRMDEVMSPEPLDPLRAMKEAIAALEEQVKARVTSVENGHKYQNSGRVEAEMPDGPAIFETTGPWEDFATPSRDLRLLIAIDVVRTFPDRFARRPDRYAMPPGKNVTDVKTELAHVLAAELPARKFSYPRSDGSSWTLSLKHVLDRATALEMAYNLNDCVELRWGAPERSAEASTCRRHAPSAQRDKMARYRAWFHQRHRPPRA
jgi:hypothetical protein